MWTRSTKKTLLPKKLRTFTFAIYIELFVISKQFKHKRVSMKIKPPKKAFFHLSREALTRNTGEEWRACGSRSASRACSTCGTSARSLLVALTLACFPIFWQKQKSTVNTHKPQHIFGTCATAAWTECLNDLFVELRSTWRDTHNRWSKNLLCVWTSQCHPLLSQCQWVWLWH